MGYIEAVGAEIDAAGVTVPLHLMQTNGGVAGADRARELPIGLAASGPRGVSAVRGSPSWLASATCHLRHGRHHRHIGLVIGASPQLRFSGEAAGMPINLPQSTCSASARAAVRSRGRRFGSLTVGPASAGAEPGPAAYGRGGTDATVTDAHVVLGTLSASALAGGVPLDRGAAERAVPVGGAPLGLGTEAAAAPSCGSPMPTWQRVA